MKKNYLLFVLLFLSGISVLPAFPQNFAGTLIDYVPAPGQHINIENIGTPQAAQKMVENTSSLVSLGSFGGYVVLKFNEACVNHPENPYGIDFTIFGNAFAGSSEPAVVWVMKDSNRNGIPDDDWYEIAGSSHFFTETLKKYEVTYFKTATRDVLWEDYRGKTGRIVGNEFNLQEYYPASEYFPSYPRDSVFFSGTLLKNEFVTSVSGEIKIAAPVFGYADSHPRLQGIDLSFPDNPYTSSVEGAGGDPVDISWATDSFGNYIDLDSIHFVKIVSASLNVAGWLGEVSTDVAWVQAVQPQPQVTGKESLLVYNQLPSKIILGDSLKLEAFYFEKGRITKEKVTIHSLNEDVAIIDSSGMLVTLSPGETQLRFSAREEAEQTSLKVVVPDSIRIVTDLSAVYPGDTLELIAEVYDNESERLDLVVHFASSDSPAGKVITAEGKYFFVALISGEITLTAFVDNFQLNESVAVQINSINNKRNVLLTIKSADENLLPLQQVEIGLADLNAFVESRQHDYSGMDKVTLFHALAKGLQKAGVPFKFRDDATAGGNLYLYMVENDGLFSYGWGGKTNPVANARAWIVRLNDSQHINGFNKILLSDNDTIVLYHVTDILSDWNFSRLVSDKLSVAAGESIEILLEQTSCTYQEGKIVESEFSPVSNAPINAGSTWYTDETGKIQISPQGNFPLVVSSGSDALLITEEVAVSAGSPTYAFTIYPNPVDDQLFISWNNTSNYGNGKYRITLIGSAGKMLMQEEVKSLPAYLDLSSFVPGVYQLIIGDGRQLEIHKIVKR